jgi:S-adenosylmethionine hydrolase
VHQQPIITLTSDFGLADPYVASMKGVILSLNPRATVVDVTHSVIPQRIEQAAFLLETALPYFPPQTIHVAVVDPGVGTERPAIALQTPNGTFIGPGNGVLSPALPPHARSRAANQPTPVHLPSDIQGAALTNPRYHLHPVSDTFHGRDIFAPAAAHLSLGVTLSDLGEAVDEMLALPPFRARKQADGSLAGRVIHVDGFGNLITNVRGEDMTPRPVIVEIRGHQIAGIRRTYASSQGLAALIGSAGFLEIAFAEASAADELGAQIGDPLVVRDA